MHEQNKLSSQKQVHATQVDTHLILLDDVSLPVPFNINYRHDWDVLVLCRLELMRDPGAEVGLVI